MQPWPCWADVLLHPTFPESEVKKKIAQEQDSIRSAKDEPREVIQFYFMKFLYGDHPYGRPSSGDERSLAKISRDDIAAFYRAHYTPGNTIVAVAGDFELLGHAGERSRRPLADGPARPRLRHRCRC